MSVYAVLVVAAVLRLLAVSGYLRAILRGTAKPNPVSWLCWGLFPLIAGLVQLRAGINALPTLLLATGPLLVLALGLARSSARVRGFDLCCGGCALAGIALWLLTDSPLWAVGLAIAADAAAGLPTLRKAYRRPDSEPGRVYLVSAASTLVALLVVTDWSFTSAGFPLYVLGLDLTVALLAISRIGDRVAAADAVIAAARADVARRPSTADHQPLSRAG